MANLELDFAADKTSESRGANYVSESLVNVGGQDVVKRAGEFWTSGQRQAHNLHEVSYRACFKPQLPRYFISRLTDPGDRVLDPFSGRGTTVIEAALMGRRIAANDANPLSEVLARPRIEVPSLSRIIARVGEIDLPKSCGAGSDPDLSMFYHETTFSQLLHLRNYLIERKRSGTEDEVDRWIRMVATNRLTGHSPGFFSVYTLPPNQAVSREAQIKINAQRNQVPPERDVKAIILKKSKQLLKDLEPADETNLRFAARDAVFMTGDASSLAHLSDSSIKLTVTSPPFLDVVQYKEDNWLRCWFNDIEVDEARGQITMAKTEAAWSEKMRSVFSELFRVTTPGGYVAFEVGEVKNGRVKLEELVIPAASQANFECSDLYINEQVFTKTANIWGVKNNSKGTNTNRIVLMKKPL